jgi:hypothetical protein
MPSIQLKLHGNKSAPTFVSTELFTLPVRSASQEWSLPIASASAYAWAEPATLPVRSAQRGGSLERNQCVGSDVYVILDQHFKITVPATLLVERPAQPGGASYFGAVC